MSQTLLITANGSTLVEGIGIGNQYSVAVSGTLDGTIKAQYATAGKVAATLSTNLTGDDNDLVFTAKNAGTGGNSLTVAYIEPSESDTELSAVMTYPDLVVTLATDSGDAAITVLESTGADNDILITALVAGLGGNDYTVTLVDPSANSSALSVSTTNYLDYIVSLATDSGGTITSTAAQVIAALTAYAPFAARMTAENNSTDTGVGVVEAIAETALTGGGDNYVVTTTAAEIATLVNGNPDISKHVTAANKASNDGTGVVIALTETALSAGTNGTFTDYESGDTGDFTAAGEIITTNVGNQPFINIVASGITTTSATVIINDLGKRNG